MAKIANRVVSLSSQFCLNGMAVLMLALIAGPAIAQGPGSYPTITGTTIDAQGAVIPGIKIMAKNIDQKRAFGGESNQAGIFRIAPLSVGRYIIYAGAPGWTLKQPVHVTVNVNSDVNLTLHMEPIAQK